MDICYTPMSMFQPRRGWLFTRHWFSDSHGFTLCGITIQWASKVSRLMEATKELMEAARASWREHYERADLTAESANFVDVIYEAYLAGFAAGQRSKSSEGASGK